MPTIAQQLTELVKQAADAAGHADSPVPLEPCVPTNDPRHGDYQSNFAFRLGKALRTNPREVAQAMVDALPSSGMVAGAEVAGPGFINFRLADDWLAADVLERLADPALGTPQPGAGKTMVIDYSSPNIAKRMHVGHMRSTVIGNALDRLYRFLGWEVIADNHVGDWGTQFGMLIVGWRNWRDEEHFLRDPIGELQRLYQLFRRQAETHPELDTQAREETARLQAGDPDNIELWKEFVAVSMQEFDTVYSRMDVHFDVVHGESWYREQLQPLVDRALEAGIAEVSEGAVVIPFEPEDGKGLAKTPMLIRKSDGAALYGTSDLACIEYRIETWDPDLIVYVTDTRQQLHFRQVFAGARKLGHAPRLQHVWFGMLRLPGGEVAATRAGGTVNLVDLLDSAAAHARALVDDKSGHLPDEERAAIAEAVGVGAIKYTDLSQNPQSDVHFDWDRMLSLEGNTAPYLMYAYARCRSIVRESGQTAFEPGGVVLDHPTERDLALQVCRVSEAVLQAAQTWKPNALTDHLYAMCKAFSRFYTECRVLGDEVPEATTRSRLSLVLATAHALQTGMHLLGLRPLERM